MKNLSDLALRAALKDPPAERRDIIDGAVPGLVLRLGPSAASWSLTLRVVGEGGVTARGHRRKGKRHRVSLGEYPAVTLQAARALANLYLDQAQKGISPVKGLEAAATAGGLTVAELTERFLRDYVHMKQLRAVFKYEGAIRVHIVPALGSQLADLVTRDDVRTLVKKVIARVPRSSGPRDRPRGGVEAARTMISVLRKMFSWARDEGLIKRLENPVAGIESNLPRKRRKDRVLTRDEARIVWAAAQTLGYPFGPVYQLILLTGCRPGEWSNAQRAWIDLKQAIAVIPAESYKSDHVHVVPLVPQAIDILKSVMREQEHSEGGYLFSGTRGLKPIAGWDKAQSRMMKAITAVSGQNEMAPWTPHDLRRTVATRIAEQLGIGGEQLIRRVLGHSDGSVTAIYNRYGDVKEMRQVLAKWADNLTGESRGGGRKPRPAQGSAENVAAGPNLRLVTTSEPVATQQTVQPVASERQLGLEFAEPVTSQNWNNILKQG